MNENTQRPMPRNIFEVINQNIVDMSQDIVRLYALVERIDAALFPNAAEPNVSGAAEDNQ